MHLPDWDYGGPSCSLKTSEVRVVWGLFFFNCSVQEQLLLDFAPLPFSCISYSVLGH